MLNFELQLFADDETPEISSAEETSTVETGTEESQPELPEEFEGLEEFHDEILAELKGGETAENTGEETGKIPVGQKVPYERFKQVNDERKALKAEIEELKKARENIPQSQPQETPPVTQQPQRQQPIMRNAPELPAPAQMRVTPEIAKAFKNAVDELAMQWTGFTPEQVKDFEFAEEGDENAEYWKSTRNLAANEVQSRIQQFRQEKALQRQQFLREHAAAVQSYNEYAKAEMSAPDYKDVLAYTTGEFFESLPPAQQQALANSYVRVERNIASPAEIFFVQAMFEKAKTAYHAQKGNNQKIENPKQKSAQAKSLPRVDRLNGANGNGSSGVLTVRDLEKLIDETDDFDKLDPRVRKIFES